MAIKSSNLNLYITHPLCFNLRFNIRHLLSQRFVGPELGVNLGLLIYRVSVLPPKEHLIHERGGSYMCKSEMDSVMFGRAEDEHCTKAPFHFSLLMNGCSFSTKETSLHFKKWPLHPLPFLLTISHANVLRTCWQSARVSLEEKHWKKEANQSSSFHFLLVSVCALLNKLKKMNI